MHEDDAPPRLRWRLLTWGIAAVILAPVLYVAASGPIVWWVANHYRQPEWYAEYRRSLTPLHRMPEFAPMLNAYRVWWARLPAPRSWRRQRLVDQLADRRKIVEDLRAVRARLDAEAEALRTRLDALEARASSPQEVPVEAIGIRLRLDEIALKRGRLGSQLTPLSIDFVPEALLRQAEEQAEDQLREFDAR